jgi:hypothetical protein
VGPEEIQQMEYQMQTIRQRIKEAQDWKKSYANAIMSTVVMKLAIEAYCG